MNPEQASFCRKSVETDIYGQPVKFCSKMISRKAQAEAGERLGFERASGLPWCPEHLARLPIWP
mgnify:CR=1 FL=1